MTIERDSTAWPVVARLRSSQPVYYVLLPPTPGSLAAGQMCLAVLVAAVAAAAAVRLDPTGGGGILPAALLLTVAVAFGGVRRGQEQYVQERERSRCLGPLVGERPHHLYLPATSGLPLALASRVAVLAPAGMIIAAVVTDRAPLVGVRLACLYGLLPAVALVGREVLSHTAVAADAVRIPQYVYALVGVGMGFGLMHLGGVLLRGGGGAAEPGAVSEHVSGWWAGVAVLAVAALFAVRRAVAGLSRLVAETGLAFAPTLPLPRWTDARLPLGLRLWTTLGRERSSVILGFFAIITVMLVQLPALVGALPGSLEGYERAELLVLVLYAVAFFSTTLFQEPLQIGQVWRRVPLLRLASVPVLAEIGGLTRAVLVPTAATTTVGVVGLWITGAFADLPRFMVPVVAALVVVSALGTTVLPALSGAALDSGKVTDELPFVEIVKSSFSGILPACLAVGFVTSAPRPLVQVVLTSVALALVAALLLFRIDRVVRRHVRSAGA